MGKLLRMCFVRGLLAGMLLGLVILAARAVLAQDASAIAAGHDSPVFTLEDIPQVASKLVSIARDILASISSLLGLAYGLACLVPGPEPDRTIEKLMRVTTRLSRKRK